jgi:hypothetical protein
VWVISVQNGGYLKTSHIFDKKCTKIDDVKAVRIAWGTKNQIIKSE